MSNQDNSKIRIDDHNRITRARVMNSLQMSAGGGEGVVDSEPNSACSLGPRAGLGSTGSEYSGTNSEEVTFAEPKKEESNLEKEQIVKEQSANNYQVIVPGPIKEGVSTAAIFEYLQKCKDRNAHSVPDPKAEK